MSPPGATQFKASPAGSWYSGPGKERDRLLNAAHLILANCGVEMSAARVRRLVQAFERRVNGNGFSFFEFLANSVAMSAMDRRAALANPDIARAINYSDPTGETAVNNVLRGAS